MKYSVEVMRVREQTIQLNGWAVESNPDSVITYRVEDEAGQPVKAKIVPTRRDDVSQIYYKKIIDRDLGFDIRFPYEHGKNYYLVICGGKKTTRVKYRYDDPQKNRRGKPQGTEAHEPYEHGDSPCCLGLLKGKWPESPDLKIQAQDPGD